MRLGTNYLLIALLMASVVCCGCSKSKEPVQTAQAQEKKEEKKGGLFGLFGGGGDSEAESDEEAPDEESSNIDSSESTTEPDTQAQSNETTSSPPPTSGGEEVEKEESVGWLGSLTNKFFGVFTWAAQPLKYENPYFWWYLAGFWFGFSVLATMVLEHYNPFDRDNSTSSLRSSIADAKDDSRSPFWGFGIFVVPFVLLVIANWEMLPSSSGAWLRLVAYMVGYIVFSMGVWAMFLRWGLFVRETYERPYNETAAKFLGFESVDDPNVEKTGSWSVAVVVPEEKQDEWIEHWELESRKLGTTYHAPEWWQNKGRIAEWTVMMPLSVQHTLWRLFVQDAFWKLMAMFGAVANFRSAWANESRSILRKKDGKQKPQ